MKNAGFMTRSRWFVLVMTWTVLCGAAFTEAVRPGTIKTKTDYEGVKVSVTIPYSLTLPRETLLMLANFRCDMNSVAYQAGCHDTKDYFLEKLGLRLNPFPSRPSSGIREFVESDKVNSYIFKDRFGWFGVNMSLFRLNVNNKSREWEFTPIK